MLLPGYLWSVPVSFSRFFRAAADKSLELTAKRIPEASVNRMPLGTSLTSASGNSLRRSVNCESTDGLLEKASRQVGKLSVCFLLLQAFPPRHAIHIKSTGISFGRILT